MFKLIAIHNHLPEKKEIQNKRRHTSIYKVLQADADYFFCKGYCVVNDIVTPQTAEKRSFSLYSEGNPDIDINAIVGKNGSGKSSLIELYLRLMNNLAYVCHKAINDGKSYNTQFVDEIYSTAYFLDTEKHVTHAVKQYGAKLTYMADGVEQFSYDYNLPLKTPGFNQDDYPTQETAKACLAELCYTMVINYSAYSYNHEDYLPEWDTVFNNTSTDNNRPDWQKMEDRCWIDSLFHKNDGYQLPIVLNPYREDGLVDYNNERDLTQDRLYSLTLLHSSPITTILNGKVLDRFVFDVGDELSPVGNKTYASYKVLSQLQSMGVLRNTDSLEASEVAEKKGKKIITTWSKCFGVDLASYAIEKEHRDGVERNPHVLQALNYIVYKTLKIAQTYQKYNYYQEVGKDDARLESYIKNLYSNDRSHITQKIRRCMSFIIFRQYKGAEMQVEQLKSAIHRTYNKRVSLMRAARKNHPFKRYEGMEEYVWTEDDFLPAPSFKVNLYLKSDGLRKQTMIGLSTMSSGERQFISSISTMAYHLSNIESVWSRIKDDSKEIGYRNVCVFFDEMDLYLHPEYQTNMIDLMLQVIRELNLTNINSIQIICATHSPFILSDVPSRNVMYLESGRECGNREMKTFAANIGDLLCHSFFLSEGLIGRFAREKVESLVDWLESEEKEDNLSELANRERSENKIQWKGDEVEAFISLIDDPYVKEQLRLMLKEYQLRKEEEHAED